jgi:hypothetical protein
VNSPPWIVLPGKRRPFSNVQVVVFFIILTRVDARAVPAKIGERFNEQTSVERKLGQVLSRRKMVPNNAQKYFR